ncbi:hypothetical protein ACHHYP_04092 [Achlya hypogyna]|uniref:Uncharacterized protein n=1 Tax=Achlya hypogyna TaxID=1202772 RepID=A0A1V9Z243_ACHHY|nr:hypothetical protein ACHHYP_04092 [Achlya hypogyna]
MDGLSGEETEERPSSVLLLTVQRDLQAHASAVRTVLTRFAERILALEEQCEKQFVALPKAIEAIEAKCEASSAELATELRAAIDETRAAIPDYSDQFEVLDRQVRGLADNAADLHAEAMAQIGRVAEEATNVRSIMTSLGDAQRRATMAIHSALQGAVENIQIARGADKDEVMENIAVVQKTFAAQVDDIYKHVDDVMAKPPVVVIQTPEPPPRPATPPPRRVEPVVISFEAPTSLPSTPAPVPATPPPPEPEPPAPMPVPVPVPATPEKKTFPPMSVPPSNKIPVAIHARRREHQSRAPPAQTDLGAYELPPEMKHKIEHNVRATLDLPKAQPVALPPPPAAPPQPPPKASPPKGVDGPRTAEVEAQLQACQSGVEMVRSLLEVTRSQMKMNQDERDVVLAKELGGLRAKIKKVREELHTALPLLKPAVPEAALLPTPDLALGHVPSLRTALLELSRNLNVVRQTRKAMSSEMRRNLDKVIDVINDAYHAAVADAPDTTGALLRHVDRVARALAFGISSTVTVLTTADAVSAKEVAATVEGFSAALTCRLQDDTSADDARQHVAALADELQQAKTELRGSILQLQQRMDDAKSGGLKTVQSRHDFNDRGKALATLEHEVGALRAMMDERDETLQRLAVDLDAKADKRQLSR